jgi:hypothetical protein
MSDGRGHNKVPVAIRPVASADATVERDNVQNYLEVGKLSDGPFYEPSG